MERKDDTTDFITIQHVLEIRKARIGFFGEIENVDGITCFSLPEYSRHTTIQKCGCTF